MARLRFGKHEDLHVIVDVQALGPNGEAMSLAFKTSSYWVGGGVYLADDGYVLVPRGQSSTYYPLPLNTPGGKPVEGLPSPLPAYSVPIIDYVVGYSLWLAIVVAIGWAVAASKLKAKRNTRFAEKLQSLPVSYGPPRVSTKGDHAIAATVQPLLRAGEAVQHQAYTRAWDFGTDTVSAEVAYFVVLTSQRVLLMTTRVGAFGILYENLKLESFERSQILNAVVDDGALHLTFAGGTVRGFVVKSTKDLSNQQGFLTDVARILTERRG